jgi:hypothetical protein
MITASLPAPAALSAEAVATFVRDGCVAVRGAFARADAQRMRDIVWRRLADFSIVRDDRATWNRQFAHLNTIGRDYAFAAILSDRLRGAFDQLAGPGHWRARRNWGGVFVTFPSGDGPWRLADGGWHWDTSPSDQGAALFVLVLLDDTAPGGGGTLLGAGTPRMLQRYYASLGPAQPPARMRRHRKRFGASDPWLAELTGALPDGGDRTARFRDRVTSTAAGDALRVIEVAGGAGDVFVCHPCMLHVGSQNRADRPRLMRISTIPLAPALKRDELPAELPLVRAAAPLP